MAPQHVSALCWVLILGTGRKHVQLGHTWQDTVGTRVLGCEQDMAEENVGGLACVSERHWGALGSRQHCLIPCGSSLALGGCSTIRHRCSTARSGTGTAWVDEAVPAVGAPLPGVGAALLSAAQHYPKAVVEPLQVPARRGATPLAALAPCPTCARSRTHQQHLQGDQDQGLGWATGHPTVASENLRAPGPPGPTVHPLCAPLCPSPPQRKMEVAFCLAEVRQSRFVR